MLMWVDLDPSDKRGQFEVSGARGGCGAAQHAISFDDRCGRLHWRSPSFAKEAIKVHGSDGDPECKGAGADEPFAVDATAVPRRPGPC
jgi:hypothetical protein